MSDIIDISVGLTEERVEINSTPNVVEVNIITGQTINPLSYDLIDFTNISANPFVQYSTLGSYTPISRALTINGVTQDLSADRSWLIPGASWGSITGTLSAQTDLQTALDAKFDNPTGNSTQYLDGAGTPVTFPAFASADKMVTVGRNSTGSTLYKGTIVYISGSTGNRPNFVKAQANAEATSAGTFGVIEADIANNADGNCVTIGTIDNLDTRSSAPHPFTSDTLADGDTIYLSPTTAGFITNVKPYAPSHLVYLGKVVRTSPTNGTIVYRVQNGYELDELHDVAAQTPSDGQVLTFETATQLWKPKTIATGITIGTTAITSGTVGRVLFEGTGNVVQESANLFWDNTNGRLGIGTSSPLSPLDVVTSAVTIYPRLRTTSTASNTDVGLRFQDGTTGIGNSDGLYLGRAASINYLWTYEAEPLVFGTNNAERMRLFSTGNFAINTTTDAGYKLDVNGTARVSVATGTLINQFTVISSSSRLDISPYDSSTYGVILRPSLNNAGSFVPLSLWGSRIQLEGSVHISANATGGNASAQLDVTSTTKGFLPPRMTTTQKNAIASPAEGLQVWDTTLKLMSVYNGTAWITL